jgi:hypothetical protein
MDLIQQHEAEDFADPRHRLEQVEGLRIMRLGRFDDVSLQVAEERVIVADQREVHFHTLLDGRVGKPRSDAVAVRFVGNMLPKIEQIVLAVGLLDVGQQLCPFAYERHAPPQQVPGRTHRGGIDVGLRKHAPAEQHGTLVGVDLVVFGLAAMDRLHRARVPEDQRDPFLSTQVREPGPR